MSKAQPIVAELVKSLAVATEVMASQHYRGDLCPLFLKKNKQYSKTSGVK